jgi:hypothetical protein
MTVELSNINAMEKEQDVVYFTSSNCSYTFYIDKNGNLQIKKSSPINKN